MILPLFCIQKCANILNDQLMKLMPCFDSLHVFQHLLVLLQGRSSLGFGGVGRQDQLHLLVHDGVADLWRRHTLLQKLLERPFETHHLTWNQVLLASKSLFSSLSLNLTKKTKHFKQDSLGFCYHFPTTLGFIPAPVLAPGHRAVFGVAGLLHFLRHRSLEGAQPVVGLCQAGLDQDFLQDTTCKTYQNVEATVGTTKIQHEGSKSHENDGKTETTHAKSWKQRQKMQKKRTIIKL